METIGLFAGIGGFELGLARAGHGTALLCENEPAAAAVLRARFPGAVFHDDVRTLSALPGAELLVGGFPCQDLSQAGNLAGIDGARSGLVREVFRLLGPARIPWVVLENVPFMLSHARGTAMGVVVEAFERLGYAWAYRVVDSRAFGLPQRRERVFFVASRDGGPEDVLLADDAVAAPRVGGLDDLAHGFYWTEGRLGLGWAVDAVPPLKTGSTVGIPAPPAVLMPDGRIVKPDLRDAERLQGFPEEWTAPADAAVRRSRRWALVGNAVSVPTAEWLGRRLAAPGSYDCARDLPMPDRGWPRAARGRPGFRVASSVSTAPAWDDRPPLHRFLVHPGTPLSARATSGFLGRARAGRLRFAPGFLDRVGGHLAAMGGDAG